MLSCETVSETTGQKKESYLQTHILCVEAYDTPYIKYCQCHTCYVTHWPNVYGLVVLASRQHVTPTWSVCHFCDSTRPHVKGICSIAIPSVLYDLPLLQAIYLLSPCVSYVPHLYAFGTLRLLETYNEKSPLSPHVNWK